MDLFDEITQKKEEFPKFNTITSKIKRYKFNFYQKFAIVIFILCFFLGIILGNLFPTCEATSYFSSDVCVVTEFNFSLMIIIWFLSLLLSLFIFSIGHIIALLGEINKKLGKFSA